MVDNTQLSETAINDEMDHIRKQLRSFAKQRAEGLIDETLQRDLSSELFVRMNELEALQQNHSSTNGASHKSEDAPQETVDAEVDADEITESETVEADTTSDQIEQSVSEEEADTANEVDEPVEASIAEIVDATTDDADVEDVAEVPEVEDAVLPIDEIQAIEETDESNNEVAVASALVKEPEYLNTIQDAVVVDIRDITKTYQMGEFELEVLKGVTLQVRQGEFISIMGPSGSGKSTLMNILGALDQSTSGEYFLDGTDVSQMTEVELAQIRNKKIGFVFQSFNLLKRTSALRQVELPLIYGSGGNRTQRARAALEAVGLGNRTDHTPAELSGGQQQRVAIARAIVNEPSLILADEPTGNLDSRSGSEVMEIFQRMNREQNITTILVTHDPWIARHTERVIMLRDGKIIADQRVKQPLIAGQAERPSEAEELQEIFEDTYYGGNEQEYN